EFSAAPPLPQGERSVTIDAPSFEAPPPDLAPSPEELLREEINAVLKDTIALKPEWKDAVLSAFHRAASPFGGDIFAMGLEGLKSTLTGVKGYQARVQEAVGVRR